MWSYQYPDELYHWKYIKKEKDSNGKWRYYYDKGSVGNEINDKTNTVSTNLATVSPEASRTMDDLLYKNASKALDVEKDLKLKQIEYEEHSSKLSKDLKITSVVVSNKVKKGAVDIMQRLNMIGDGMLDNKVRDIAIKGRAFLKSIFG